MLKKKSLGQHFLTADTYIRAVADAADVAAGDTVLEIGPGDGALTRELLFRGAQVVVIEKDHRLIPILGARFDTAVAKKQLTIIEGDALEIEPADILPPRYKVVANIPYYITGALLRKYLTSQSQPSVLVFLMQKEVAERIARSKKESLLSLSVKAYGKPVYVKTVPRGAFSPAPEVDSAILCISSISRTNFTNPQHEERFFALLHAGFGQKRKLLVRNIEGVVGDNAAELLQRAGIEPKARAEDVPLKEWLQLSAL
jgi:16S rRNA (adenine1518-N6/adenine1519-N6)-dimethyltransferase